jgi:hypothetical protein
VLRWREADAQKSVERPILNNRALTQEPQIPLEQDVSGIDDDGGWPKRPDD